MMFTTARTTLGKSRTLEAEPMERQAGAIVRRRFGDATEIRDRRRADCRAIVIKEE